MTEDQQQLVHHKDFKMKNFCLYNGKKTVKPETWNITSVELSSDYTSAIIQAESKSNKSEYTLDITPLISNQYKQGLDVNSATIVNELTGVSDWVLDSANNQIVYTKTIENTGVYSVVIDGQSKTFSSAQTACSAWLSSWEAKGHPSWQNLTVIASGGTSSGDCILYGGTSNYNGNTGTSYSEIAAPQEEEKSIPLDVVAQQVISNAANGDVAAQNSIVSTFNNITDDILTSDYSEFFEANKQPK